MDKGNGCSCDPEATIEPAAELAELLGDRWGTGALKMDNVSDVKGRVVKEPIAERVPPPTPPLVRLSSMEAFRWVRSSPSPTRRSPLLLCVSTVEVIGKGGMEVSADRGGISDLKIRSRSSSVKSGSGASPFSSSSSEKTA